jgi:acetolactate synthase-1/2/3 large subunit
VKISDAISVELERQAVRAVFTLMSEDTARLVVAVSRGDIPLYSTRHDSTAVGMADGYARATGKVGVAIVGRGPGLTNSMNALITASKAGTSMVVLVGDTPLGIEDPARARAAAAERVGKYIDQTALLRSAGVTTITLTSPSTALPQLARCFEQARRDGVVTVNMPADVLEATMPTTKTESIPPIDALTMIAPSQETINLVADLITESWAARHPVVLAGDGAVSSGAHNELQRLGEVIGALMATSLKGSSFFRTDPYNIGVFGTLSTPLASELLSEADLVLAFGASLNQFTTYRGDLLRRKRVIHFDSDSNALGRYHPADVAVLGDARQSAASLIAELDRRGHQAVGYRTREIAERIANFRLADSVTDRGRRGALDPRMVMMALDKILPLERTLVVDGGHHWEFSVTHIGVPDPSALVLPNEYSSVGCGLAVALGVAVGRPDRLTVLDEGDGGLMMNLGDVDTAVRYGLRLVIIVSNDSAFGSEVHYLQVNGLPDEAARYQNPSFAAVAKSLGAVGLTIESLDHIDQVGAALASLAGPLVLDCKLTTEVRAGWVDLLFGRAASSSKPLDC